MLVKVYKKVTRVGLVMLEQLYILNAVVHKSTSTVKINITIYPCFIDVNFWL